MTMKLDTILLLVIACMLGFVAYQSVDLVKASVISAKIHLHEVNDTGVKRPDIDKQVL